MADIIALYPGQGSQYPKMALDLHQASKGVRRLFEQAGDICRIDFCSLLERADEGALKQTETTQLVVTLANRSAAIRLQERGVDLIGHAGFSLGELSAYAGASIIDDTQLFSIVAKRSALMAEAGKTIETRFGALGMAAVIGLGFDEVAAILADRKIFHLYCANDNGPSQVVVSGLLSDLETARPHLLAGGARKVIGIPVSGPFHTPFMQEAVAEFKHFLKPFVFENPKSTVISSVSGTSITEGAEAKRLCSQQLEYPVRWNAVMQELHKRGHLLGEVGPKEVLTGLWNRGGYGRGTCVPLGTESAIQTFSEEQRYG